MTARDITLTPAALAAMSAPPADAAVLVACHTCGTEAPAGSMAVGMNYRPGSRMGTRHLVCSDSRACAKTRLAADKLAAAPGSAA